MAKLSASWAVASSASVKHQVGSCNCTNRLHAASAAGHWADHSASKESMAMAGILG